MKDKIKTIFIGIVIGIIAFPTIALGGTFVSSLIQGKTVEEAVQILAEQIDSLIGRVEVVEITQKEHEQTISELQVIIDQQKAQIIKEEACRKANELKYAPQETKIGEYLRGTPIYMKHAPDTTEALLEYLHGYWQNYQKTGSRYYMANPDYDPELVKKYIPTLEARWKEYLIQKALCEQ